MKKAKRIVTMLLLIAVVGVVALFVIQKINPDSFLASIKLIKHPSVDTVAEHMEQIQNISSNADVPEPPFQEKEVDCGGSGMGTSIPSTTGALGDSLGEIAVSTGVELNTGISPGEGITADKCYIRYTGQKSNGISKWKAIVLLMAPPFERWALMGSSIPSPATMPMPTKAWGPSQGAIDTYYGESTTRGTSDTEATSVTSSAAISVGFEFEGVGASVTMAIEEGIEESSEHSKSHTFGTTHALNSDVDSIKDHSVIVARTHYYDYEYKFIGGIHTGKKMMLSIPHSGDKKMWTLEKYNEYNEDNETDIIVPDTSHAREVGSVKTYPTYESIITGQGTYVLYNTSMRVSPNLDQGTTTWEYVITESNTNSTTRSQGSTLGISEKVFGSGFTIQESIGSSHTHSISFATSSSFGGSIGNMASECEEKWDYTMAPSIYWWNPHADQDYHVLVVGYYITSKGPGYSSNDSKDKNCQEKPYSSSIMIPSPYTGEPVNFDDIFGGGSGGSTGDADVAIDPELQIDIDQLKIDLSVLSYDEIAINSDLTIQINDLSASVNTAEPAMHGSPKITTSESENELEKPKVSVLKWEKPEITPNYIEISDKKKKLWAVIKPLKEEEKMDFEDLPATNSYYKAVQFLSQNEILRGYPDKTFKIEKPLNRAEALKIILEGLKTAGLPTFESVQEHKFNFSDAYANQWYAPYLKYATENDIIKGYPDGTVKLENTVNKVELLKMLFKISGFNISDIDTNNTDLPSDVSKNDWYLPYAVFALENNLVDLDDNKFYPATAITRGEASEILYRFITVLLGDMEWITYQNEKHSYEIDYPDKWYFIDDVCCPPPPTYVMFNNYSASASEYNSHQLDDGIYNLSILCGYEGDLEEIGEVELKIDEGVSHGETTINGSDAIKFTESAGPDSDANVISFYLVNGEEGCKVIYLDECSICGEMLSTFEFE